MNYEHYFHCAYMRNLICICIGEFFNFFHSEKIVMNFFPIYEVIKHDLMIEFMLLVKYTYV